jgi:hypothetical protein
MKKLTNLIESNQIIIKRIDIDKIRKIILEKIPNFYEICYDDYLEFDYMKNHNATLDESKILSESIKKIYPTAQIMINQLQLSLNSNKKIINNHFNENQIRNINISNEQKELNELKAYMSFSVKNLNRFFKKHPDLEDKL